jgi:predicted aconitase with swiveling domain
MTDEVDQSGPIDHLVVEFPGGRRNGEAFPTLVNLADRGTLDLAVITKRPEGRIPVQAVLAAVEAVEAADAAGPVS